uniref:Low density lipoprotein receptor-related protein 11 n=1 Tax=Sinocyclocheilus rhinocerous TaxID=307959 RepID=A0A673KFV7_9TELE
MSPAAHHIQRALICSVLLWMSTAVMTRFSSTSDLKSKISGVEELLEEFRKQLQQDESDSREDEEDGDRCISGFEAVEERIIRASASIEQGAAFLSAPQRVFSWRDCAHACCSHPHCTAAIIQEDLKQPDDSLCCYLFNCTYRDIGYACDGKQHCPDRSDEDFCQNCKPRPPSHSPTIFSKAFSES